MTLAAGSSRLAPPPGDAAVVVQPAEGKSMPRSAGTFVRLDWRADWHEVFSASVVLSLGVIGK